MKINGVAADVARIRQLRRAGESASTQLNFMSTRLEMLEHTIRLLLEYRGHKPYCSVRVGHGTCSCGSDAVCTEAEESL